MYFIYQTLIIREFYLLFLLEKFICMDKKLKKTFDSIIIFFVKISEVLIIFLFNKSLCGLHHRLWAQILLKLISSECYVLSFENLRRKLISDDTVMIESKYNSCLTC